jgi:hypothetical protein
MLDGNAAMRTLMPHRRDDARLAVLPFKGSNSCCVAQRRSLAIGSCRETGSYFAPVG